jgi:hypothetical protein
MRKISVKQNLLSVKKIFDTIRLLFGILSRKAEQRQLSAEGSWCKAAFR